MVKNCMQESKDIEKEGCNGKHHEELWLPSRKHLRVHSLTQGPAFSVSGKAISKVNIFRDIGHPGTLPHL